MSSWTKILWGIGLSIGLLGTVILLNFPFLDTEIDSVGLDVKSESAQSESFPMINNQQVVNSILAECDSGTLGKQVEELITNIEIDANHWTQTKSTVLAEPEKFGWSEQNQINPCAYMRTYVSEETDSFLTGLSEDVEKALEAGGWISESEIKFTSDSTQDSIIVTLAHAGGVIGQDTIYFLPNYAERSVQFARVSIKYQPHHRLEYLEGSSETMCPCRTETSLEISTPVLFEDL